VSSLGIRLDPSREGRALRDRFLRWQCRVRQTSMRESMGRPDDGVIAALTLPGEDEPLGHVITVLSRQEAYSKLPELRHICRRTNDPAQRRTQALQLLSETYYQRHDEFSDVLTATFPPNSAGAARLESAGECRLAFEAYGHRFDLQCTLLRLRHSDPLRDATWVHNSIFNPNLHPDTVVLAFEPDWDASEARLPR
jgi:hypothetical protein